MNEVAQGCGAPTSKSRGRGHKLDLSPEAIRDIYLSPDPWKVICQRHGVTIQIINNIRWGRSYRWCTRELGPAKRRRGIRVSAAGAAEIFTSTERVADLAQRYGISQWMVECIKRSLVYKKHTRYLVRGRRPPLKRINDPELVRQIFLYPKSAPTTAAHFGVSTDQVIAIRDRRNYRSATKGLIAPSRRASATEKLTPVKALMIYLSDKPRQVLKKQFGVGDTCISAIRNGTTWRSVTAGLQSSARTKRISAARKKSWETRRATEKTPSPVPPEAEKATPL